MSRLAVRIAAAPLALVLMLTLGCHQNGSAGGNGGGNGAKLGGQENGSNNPSQDQQKGAKPGGAAGANGPDGSFEPAQSVNGKPSVTSDKGDPAAVAHRSVAQPGAPQGTDPGAPPTGARKRREPAARSAPQ